MTVPGIICSGSIVYDTLVYPFDGSAWGTTRWVKSIEYHVGGNGANTARAMAILGASVRLVGAVGNDAPADFVVKELQGSGVSTDFVTRVEAPTATTVVLVNEAGDRQFLHRLGASQDAFSEPLTFTPSLVENTSHYHFASLYILPHLRNHGSEMLRRARAAGLTTSLDTNWDAAGEWMSALAPCLPELDILFMNEDEAFMVTGTRCPATAARVVQEKGVRTAVMKLGGSGCGIYSDDREILCPAFPVPVKDTTGAGDCFVAGFLDARQRGASWAEAGEFANAVGALSVQKLGAVTGVISRAETEAWMSTPLK
ncbi:MAG: carbohydrate kinase family protein [Bryobacteraceae bacterium]